MNAERERVRMAVASDEHVQIPEAWEHLKLEPLSGVLLVVGAPDSGKSTFARYLYCRLSSAGKRPAFVDGDPGQAVLGPPTMLTLALPGEGDTGFPPQGGRWRVAMGNTSPRGHMLPLVVAARRLVRQAQNAGAEAIVYDTCGLVDPGQGGAQLKWALVDLLEPAVVFGIQRGDELEPLLLPLRRSPRTRVVDLRATPAVQRRDAVTRQAHRADQFRRYFTPAVALEVDWSRLAVFPAPRFSAGQLLALEDAAGFTLALGVVLASSPSDRSVQVLTPLHSAEGVRALRLSDLALDTQTFRESREYC